MRHAICLLLALFLTLSACGGSSETDPDFTGSSAPGSSVSSGGGEENPDPQAPAAGPAGEDTSQEEESMMQMKIGETAVAVQWEDNEAVQALRDLCARQPLTISLSRYGGFEQVGAIGTDLPRNDVQTRTQAGDIVLYAGNQIVVFYGSNAWAYTRLGHITDQDEAGMTDLLSRSDVTLTLTARQGRAAALSDRT